VIDDRKGATVASASSLEKDMRASLKTGADIGAAKAVGKRVANAGGGRREDVVFDRGNYLLSRPRQSPGGRCARGRLKF